MIIVGILAGVAVVAALAVVMGRVIFDRRISGEIDELLARSRDARPAVVTEADLAGLPEPVQRWLRYSQVVGRERPVTVRLKQTGQFRMGEERGWMPFTAEEYFTTDPPGFVWVATFKMAPLLYIAGRDRYADGMGSINMRLLSLIPVADKSGGGLNQGALLRYLNEMMWFPAAALSPYITWEAIDAKSARATMSYAGMTASGTFVFDEQGRLTDMTAERYNDAKGRLLPWSTPIAGYGEFGGVRVPIEGEGKWKYESGDFTYIRLKITDVKYTGL